MANRRSSASVATSRDIDIVGNATGHRIIRVPATEPLAGVTLEKATPLRKWTGIELRAVHYFAHPTRYRCEQTLDDIDGSGIWCPPFASYVDNLSRSWPRTRRLLLPQCLNSLPGENA